MASNLKLLGRELLPPFLVGLFHAATERFALPLDHRFATSKAKSSCHKDSQYAVHNYDWKGDEQSRSHKMSRKANVFSQTIITLNRTPQPSGAIDMRLVVAAALPIFAVGVLAQDAPKPLLVAEQTWVMHYDMKLDGKLDAASHGKVRWQIVVRNNRVSGMLADAKERGPNDHRLAGEIVAGKPPILFMRQDGPKGLVCFYSGKRVAEDKVAGTWFDNRGNSGDFELTIEPK